MTEDELCEIEKRFYQSSCNDDDIVALITEVRRLLKKNINVAAFPILDINHDDERIVGELLYNVHKDAIKVKLVNSSKQVEKMREAAIECVKNLSHEDGIGLGSQRIENAIRSIRID